MTVNQNISAILKEYDFIENAFIPKSVTIPLCQENSYVCKSVVNPGQKVSEGQVIGEFVEKNSRFVIHSSVPGIVSDVVSCTCPSGKREFAIKILTGGEFSFLGKKTDENKEKEMKFISKTELLLKISEAGIVNTFISSKPENLFVQLKMQNKNKNESKNLIVRTFDEDFTRISDSLVTKFNLEKIIKGLFLCAKSFSAKNIVLAVPFEKKEEYENLLQKPEFLNLKESFSKEMNFFILPVKLKKYPFALKKNLIENFSKNIFKKQNVDFKIKKDDLFTDSPSMLSVYNTILSSVPQITQNVHFSGNCLFASCILNVRIGTLLKDVVNQLGGLAKRPSVIVINGKISGFSVKDLEVPVTKYVKSVQFISNYDFTDFQIWQCVSCGNCRSCCPEKLSPDMLVSKSKDLKNTNENSTELDFLKSSLLCTECGKCNTVCPSRIPLLQSICVLKENILNNKNDFKKDFFENSTSNDFLVENE